MTVCEWWWDGYVISTDASRLDPEVVRQSMKEPCRFARMPAGSVDRLAEGSVVFGLYDGHKQVGFARVVTDGSACARIAEFFLTKAHRRPLLNRWILEVIVAHPALQGLRLERAAPGGTAACETETITGTLNSAGRDGRRWCRP